jgi:Zn-dependent protease with chaperone function
MYYDAIDDIISLDPSIESFLIDAELQSVTEGFVGKTKNIEAITKNFKVLVDKYKDIGEDIIKVATTDINNSKEIRNIEQLIEEEFGFGTAVVFVENTVMANAMTFPKSAMLRKLSNDMPEAPLGHGGRYYDKNHSYFFTVNITARLFSLLTAEELTAILLHEIGHNFDITLSCYILDIIGWICCLPVGALKTTALDTLLHKLLGPYIGAGKFWILKLLDAMVIPAILGNLFLTVHNGIKHVLGPLGATTELVENVVNQINSNGAGNFLAQIPVSGLGVGREKFADSFANSYGYGPSLISALDKMEQNKMVMNRGSFVEAWTWSGQAIIVPVMMLLDPHPETMSRCHMIMEDARKASEDPRMPAKLRAVAKENYKQCVKAYKYYKDMPDRENSALKFSRNLKDRIFGGRMDIRTYLYTMSAMIASRGHN